MSSPGNEGAQPAGDAKSGFRKLFLRVKTALQGSDGSKRRSFLASKPAAAAATKSAEPSQPADTTAGANAPTEPAAAATTMTAPKPQPVKVKRSQIDADRAKRLAERFRVTFEPHEWGLFAGEKEAYRVEKPIRMRIHRSCHLCSTAFGGSRACPNCQHPRCDKCPRFPLAKEAKKQDSAMLGSHVGYIEPDDIRSLREQMELIRPSYKAGGQPLVRKKIVQRVRRTCHDCSTMFPPGERTCTNCGHARCTDCPRDPAKKKRYPDGYPNDAPSSTSTRPIKFVCHKCSKGFPAVPHPSSAEFDPDAKALICVRCGHERCEGCSRAEIVKVDVEPDPDVLRRVEERLRARKKGVEAGEMGGAGGGETKGIGTAG